MTDRPIISSTVCPGHPFDPAVAAASLHADIKRMALAGAALDFAIGEALAVMRERGWWALRGYSSFAEFIADPDNHLSHTSVYRALRVQELRASANGGTGLIDDDTLTRIGVARADMIRPRLLTAGSADERQDWMDKAASLSVSDLRKELAAADGLDVDAAWRASVEHFVRELRRTGTRLELAPDPDAAAGLLDGIVAQAMKVRAGLEAKG